MRQKWSFNGGTGGFSYADDMFRFTSNPDYAAGSHAPAAGLDGKGALRVTLGGVDGTDVAGMSGGWRTSFTLDARQEVTLSFRVKLTQSAAYERDERSKALVAIDGELVGPGAREHVARIAGDGEGGPARSTGWKLVELDLGELGPGPHTLELGGFNNRKTDRTETTTVLFDDVGLQGNRVGGSGGGGNGLSPFEAQVLALTNEFRVAHGKEPFGTDRRLNAAAEDWSREMARGDFFRHSSPDQVEEHGYHPSAWGENIAAGYPTPESVVDGWIDSPGHRANLLSDRFDEMGVGYHHRPDDGGSAPYGHYWTQVFGTESDTLV